MKKLFYSKKVLILSLLILSIAILIFYREKNDGKKSPFVCVDKSCFSVEVSDTKSSREIGLMNRASLDMNKGMLFVFDSEGIYPFWMKNTLIPLDVIWIDSLHKVVEISSLSPCSDEEVCPSYTPKNSAKYVLEINAGLTEKYGIKVGETASISYLP